MQDRFKFKIKFETDGKVEIFDVSHINFETQQVFFQREDGIDYNIGLGVEGAELIQCTGLKDKNGKLIYEGDIVKDLTYSCDVRYLCAFIPIFGGLGLLRKQDLDDYNFCKENWESYGTNEEVRRLDNRFKLANQGNKLKCFSMHELKMNDLEIIGNIYENSELLNADT